MTEQFRCAVCGKAIKGEPQMTVKNEWIKKGGFGSPPPEAVVYVCNEKCADKA